jgi:hypothetical protein
MTPREFEKRMDAILAGADLTAVKRDGMALIISELGLGMPAYMPALERFAVRLERDAPRQSRPALEPLT